MSNFEEWWENYKAPQHVLTTDDLRKAYKAGWTDGANYTVSEGSL
jgi:hypothetical protein